MRRARKIFTACFLIAMIALAVFVYFRGVYVSMRKLELLFMPAGVHVQYGLFPPDWTIEIGDYGDYRTSLSQYLGPVMWRTEQGEIDALIVPWWMLIPLWLLYTTFAWLLPKKKRLSHAFPVDIPNASSPQIT